MTKPATSSRRPFISVSTTPTGLGPLNGPFGPEPAARLTYMATWYDGIGRTEGSANYGTNGNMALAPRLVPGDKPNRTGHTRGLR